MSDPTTEPAPTPSAPTFINDEQTTTYTQRRIVMQLDPGDRMTIGRLRDFLAFATAAGAGDDEPLMIGQGVVSVMRPSTSESVSNPPTP